MHLVKTNCKQGRFCHSQKLLFTMRVSFLAATILCLSVSSWAYSQKTITLAVTKESLRDVLNRIAKSTDYRFIYSDDPVFETRLVTLKVKQATLDEVMPVLIEGTGLSYKVNAKNLVVVCPEQSSNSAIAPDPIKGKVTDEKGNPLSGVSVSVKGTSRGTTTRSDGSFSIEAKPGDVFEFSMVGYVPASLTLQNEDLLSIRLIPEVATMANVVVVGYGTQKQKNLTGSVAIVSGKDLTNVPVSNITNALAGRLTGVFAYQPGGVPGSSSNVLIRGKSTISNSDPIYVIDGIVRSKSDFDMVDPNDIDNISVLKDASAVAVYGSRGGNGVIIVTTKRGSRQKPVFGYSAYAGTSGPTQVPDRMNSYEQAVYLNDKLKTRGVSATDPRYYTDDELDIFKSGKINTDWFELVRKDPVVTQHNLSVNGGSEAINYFMSAGYYKETGLINNLNYNRVNLRANIDAKVSRSLKISLNLDGNVQKTSRPYWPADSINSFTMQDFYRGILNQPPMSPAYVNGLPDGTLYHWHAKEVIDHGGYVKQNPNVLNGLLKLSYTAPFLKGLGADVSYNYNRQQNIIQTRYNSYTLYRFNVTGAHGHIVGDQLQSTVTASQRPYDFLQRDYSGLNAYTLDASVHYENIFGRHSVKALLLYEQYENNGESFTAKAENPLSTIIDQLFLTDPDPQRRSLTGTGVEAGRASVISRLNYAWNDRYLFEANFRYDGSSTFPAKNKWGFFPSVSAGWILSEESFFKNANAINYLKLRASYGLTGNDQVALSQWYSTFNVGSNAVFGVVTPTITPSRYANPDITWEKIRQTNAGIDATFWNGKLSGSVDYFFKHTYDILLAPNLVVPGTFGIALASVNSGKVNNQGVEVSVRHENRTGDGRYFFGVNFSYYKNTVKEYPQQATVLPYQVRTGKPIDYITGYEAVGIARTPEDLQGTPTYNGRPFELGDIIFKDQDKDGKITATDNVVLSTQSLFPNIMYGINAGGSWKGFDITALFQGAARRKLLFPNRDQWDQQAVLAFWNDHWTPDNVNTAFPKAGGLNATQSPNSSFWVRDAGYIRLKNLEIGYTIPKGIIERLHMQRCRFYLSGYNLLTITPLKDYDPEFQSTYGAYQYPIMRSINVGVNLSF
jgi:TonB-linked SusC/RagA family outer membrane protein